jgi:ribonuclease VapC
MIVDTSGMMAILFEEREEHAFRSAVRASIRLLSASTRVELGLVTLARKGEPGLEMLHALLKALRLDTIPVSAEHAGLAIDAFRRFGNDRHPAGLNFGDCFSYALAKATGEPLLFKGDGFSKTDIKRAV